MHRLLLLAGALSAMVVSASVDLSACGDKFLRIGRSARTNGYAAVYPSSILLFVPKAAKASAVRDFEKELKKAGHRFQAVATIQALPGALAAGNVDIVIAGSDDLEWLKTHTQASPSTPFILPLVNQSNASVLASLEQRYGHVLKLPSDKYDALVEIDHVMEARARTTSTNGLRQ